jgi:hypothetical protein
MPSESTTHHQSKTARWVIGVGVAFVALLASPILLLWHSSWSAGRRIDELQNSIRAKNQPLTPEDLNDFYAAPPHDKDVTQLILAALEPLTAPAFSQDAMSLPLVGNSQTPIPPPGQPWADLDDVERFLVLYSSSLERLHEVARKNGAARFPVDFRFGSKIMLPHAQNLRSGVRMLALEAHVRAHRGDAHGTAESIQSMLALAKSIENEPILISQLVHIATRRVGYSLIRDLLPHLEFSDNDLNALQKAVRDCDHRQGQHRACIGERVLGLQSIRNPAAAGIPPGAVVVGWMAGGNEDSFCYLEMMSSLVDATAESWTMTRSAADGVNSRIQEIASSKGGRIRHMMTMFIFPAVGPSWQAGARGEVDQHATDIAIAAERHRRRQGSQPADLDALVPTFLPMVPRDPFDGQPMRFRMQGEELLIYSVGVNGIDDGGLMTVDARGEPDIVIRLVRKATSHRQPPE